MKAPIGGISGRALRSEGSLVNPATEDSLLTTIVQVDPLWGRFSLSEDEHRRLREAGREERAVVTLASADGTPLAGEGRLNFAASSVDRDKALSLRVPLNEVFDALQSRADAGEPAAAPAPGMR